MIKFDLHIVSIPDGRAQSAVAEAIVSINHDITMAIALEMAKSPPILLCHNFEADIVQKYVDTLKVYGVEFKLLMSKAAGAPPIDKPPPPADIESSSKSGAHADSFGFGTVKKLEERARRKGIIAMVIAVGLILVLGLFVQRHGKTSAIRVTGVVKASKPAAKSGGNRSTDNRNKNNRDTDNPSRSNQPNAAPADNPAPQGGNIPRSQINSAQKKQANNYIDSAKTNKASDAEKSIAFYKLAISFNRYNLAAWQGLAQAYRDLDRLQEAKETEDRILAIFGGEIYSAKKLVKKFGELLDAHTDADGVYKVEYKTKKRKRDDILKEIFKLTRSVHGACKCRDISIQAITPAGGGMIVRTTPETSIHTLSGFAKNAEIIWLD